MRETKDSLAKHSPESDDFVPNKGELCWCPEKSILSLAFFGARTLAMSFKLARWGDACGVLVRVLDREQKRG